MALKIVQYLDQIAPPNNGISTSSPISLKSGYLRLAATGGSVCIKLDADSSVGVTTLSGFTIPQNHVEILKERIARQQISGITTGSTTTITFGENFGNPFVVGDHVTVEGALPSEINLVHKNVLSRTDNSIVVDHDSSSVGVAITSTNAKVSRSIKICASATSNNTILHVSEVQISGQ